VATTTAARRAEEHAFVGLVGGQGRAHAHVEADVVDEQIALYDMAGALALDEPALAHDIVFGARVLERLEADFSEHLLSSWSAGRSSLLPCRLA
jgi:hypothetical protein